MFIVFEFFVLLNIYFKKFSNGSVRLLGGLHKTLTNALHLLSNKISTESDPKSLVLKLKSISTFKLKASPT